MTAHDASGKPREAFGVAGTRVAAGDAAPLVRSMLSALRHRGRQSAGIVTCHDAVMTLRAGAGRITDVFPDELALHEVLPALSGAYARVVTDGVRMFRSACPFG